MIPKRSPFFILRGTWNEIKFIVQAPFQVSLAEYFKYPENILNPVKPCKIKQVLTCGLQLNYDKHFNQRV